MIKYRKSATAAAALAVLLALSGCKGASSPTGSGVSAVPTSAAPRAASSAAASAPAKTSSAPAKASSAAPSSQAPRATPTDQPSPPKTSAAAPASAVSQPPAKAAAVTLTIDATKGGDGVVTNSKSVALTLGDTVYSLLRRYCSSNGILLAAQKSGDGMYVSAIDGVAQFDNGPQSGWIYSVDGAFPQTGCDSYKLKSGDVIRWVYTVDLGKTEEGK